MRLPAPAFALCLAACAASPAGDPELARVVERYRAALRLPGDAPRGRALYEKSCLHCHRAGAQGHDAGPDLAAFRSRSPEQLLADVIDPNREVKPQYVGFRILTRDGRLLDGLMATQDAESVTLKRGFGETDTVRRSEIEKIESSGLSLMPEGLEQGIDLQQMADLLAFIRGYH